MWLYFKKYHCVDYYILTCVSAELAASIIRVVSISHLVEYSKLL